jgi:hypothetical protein
MKPTCPTCSRRMSPAPGLMFVCAGCRELVQFFDVRPIDDSLPWWEKYLELPSKPSNQGVGFNAGVPKTNPRRLSRQGSVTRWMTSGEP